MANHTKGRPPANKTVAPATDKSFQVEVRKAKGKQNRFTTVTTDLYNKMYDAYMEKQTISSVAKACGVNYGTAKKYIEKGDPKRSLRPLRDRYSHVMMNAQVKQDYDLAQARSEIQAAARMMLVRVSQKIKALKPEEVKATQISKDLKELQVIIERTLGVADATVKHETDNRFANWTREELDMYVETGVTPDHDRSIAPISTGKGVSD